MLPDEDESVKAMWPEIRDDFNEAERLHDVVIAALFTEQATIKGAADVNTAVVHTAYGLLTKACKTFRAIERVAETGLGEDAMVLARSLMETTFILLFILERESMERAAMYHTHIAERTLTMLRKWQEKGLSDGLDEGFVTNYEAHRDAWRRHVRPEIDVVRHWSGLRSLEQAAELMGHGAFYQTVYRRLSTHTHGTDFQSHLQISETGDPVHLLLPGDAHVREALHLARQLLFVAASRIDEKFGLGVTTALERVRPPGVVERKSG